MLGLSSVDYKVFFQLLRVDAMKFILAENNGEMQRNIFAIERGSETPIQFILRATKIWCSAIFE